MKEMKDRHCSHCAFYDLLPNHTMYCGKLKRRITARKKPCKHYTIYTDIWLILKYLRCKIIFNKNLQLKFGSFRN